VTLSTLVNSLKSVSSRLLRNEFEDLVVAHWRGVWLRSSSYCAGRWAAHKRRLARRIDTGLV